MQAFAHPQTTSSPRSGRTEKAAGARGAPARVLVLFDTSRAGRRRLLRSIELAGPRGELIVAAVAPREAPAGCCRGPVLDAYNAALREHASEELAKAREMLTRLGKVPARFALLQGDSAAAAAALAREHAVDLIIVPAAGMTRLPGRFGRALRPAGVDAPIIAV